LWKNGKIENTFNLWSKNHMKTLKLNFLSDPSHGWLSVKLADIEVLGIAGEISNYSYIRGKSAYLEEDRDAGIFLNAAKNAGWQVTYIEKYTNKRSPIRSYSSYVYVTPENEFFDSQFKIEVVADSSGRFTGNGMVYADFKTAKYAAVDLAQRWLLVTSARVVEFNPDNNVTVENTIVF